jgi:hypothetical protein
MYFELAIVVAIIVILVLFKKREGANYFEEIFDGKSIEIDLVNFDELSFTPYRDVSVYPIYLDKQHSVKFPKLCASLQKMSDVTFAMLLKIPANTVMDKYRESADISNNYIRNAKLLTNNTPDSCHIWVSGETSHLNGWVSFDHSKKHTYMNKDEKECVILVVDIVRPDRIPPGKSQEPNSSIKMNII